jgi:type I restriction enzyme S subunit
MSRYKAYPEFKESGAEWLGQLPSHWGAKRLGQFFDERREKVSDEDYPALSVTMQGIVPQLETAAKTDAGDNRKLVLKDDFVINSRSDRKGSSGVSSYDGSVSLISIVMTPRGIHPPFAHHLLRSYPFQEEFYRYGKGIVADLWSTNVSEMRNILIPHAPITEQEKISAFLDHETAKIDTLIEKQQRLIELLKEKRQAVISHAVTKGLNPNAPMKDSGVEWLGEVPAHWHSRQLKYLCSYNDEVLSETVGDDFEIEYVDIGSVSAIDGISGTETLLFGDAPSRAKRIVRDGDILISTVRTYLEAIASVQAPPNNLIASTGFAVIRPNVFLNKGYAAYCLRASGFIKEVVARSVGVSYPAINASDLVNIKTPEPSPTEQEKIASFLDHETAKMDALLEKAKNGIELLQERRTALISAAVTGKIDVRDWQVAA